MKVRVPTSIILHIIIVEARRYGYEREVFREAEKAVNNGMLIDNDDRPTKFIWSTTASAAEARPEFLDIEWAARIAPREKKANDEVGNDRLKHELV